ncbi:ornithine cyclodeaminase family protein [Halorussus salilacus]|uniref:ornithine cyclodeaminase family protein n=1 Tax=Halorussus salilacus TaxID=2953750 RepID=UPI0020A14C3B|nr:ornithine cyclodeaminase family protein [Halorussus salilacus]USZ69540.1 ornithine cyclodeaminase family protein [Halorussus salilacus]
MVRVLSDSAVADCLALDDLLPVVREAFVRQGRGEVERPDRPHFPVGAGLDGPDPAGTGLVMAAYVHGAAHYATKLVGVHEGNAERGLPTVNAQIALTEADTGLPAAYLAGTRITNARTGCIGGLAAAELAAGPVTLGLLGAGTQARWQARAVAAATDLDSIRVFSPSDSKRECAADLRAELGVAASAVDSPEDAVSGANVVVTATTSTEPVFPGSALDPGTLVVAVGAYTAEMRELDHTTFDRASRVFADVPEEVAEIGDLLGAEVDADELVSLSSVLEGDAGRSSAEEILIVESVGSAVLDAAAAEHVFERAEERGIGTEVSL